MNIVFLIGNGFDLNLGLPTRFSNFYEHYYNIRKDDKRTHIQELLNSINGDAENWSYLEKALGEYTEKFTPNTVNDFIDIWYDIVSELAQYINKQQEFIHPTNIRIGNDEKMYLGYPESFIKRGLRQPYQQLREYSGLKSRINIINFNYTNTFEKIYGWERQPLQLLIDSQHSIGIIESIHHIHGTVISDMVLGVDNTNQILSHSGLQNHPDIINRIIKPIVNEHTQTLRDADCKELIANANLICIFGMSLGVTDQTWWKLICNRLESDDAMAIIFSKDSTNPLMTYLSLQQQQNKVHDFLKAADIPDGRLASIKDKIAVSFNSNIFSNFTDIAELPLF